MVSPAVFSFDFDEKYVKNLPYNWKFSSSLDFSLDQKDFVLDRRWESFPLKTRIDLSGEQRKIPISVRGSPEIKVTLCADGMVPCEVFFIEFWEPKEYWQHIWIKTDDRLLRIQHYERDASIHVVYNPNFYSKYDVFNLTKEFPMNVMTVSRMNLKRLSSYSAKLFVKSIEVPSGGLKLHDCKFVPIVIDF